MIFEGLRADALLVIKTLSATPLEDAFLFMKTLSATPRPRYHWKAEDLSFLYVLLVWGVKLVSSLVIMREK